MSTREEMGLTRVIIDPGTLGPYVEDWLRRHGKLIKPRISKQREKELEKCFSIFDADGSGEVDEEEVKGAMEMLGIKVTEKEVREMVMEYDSDGSGQIELDEFMMMMVTYMDSRKDVFDDSPASGPKVDLESFSQALQRRDLLAKVCAEDRATINRLTMLHTAGVKTVHPPDTPEPEDFQDPPDPPGPPPPAAVPVPPSGVYNANGVNVSYGGTHLGSARTLNLRRQMHELIAEAERTRVRNQMLGRIANGSPPLKGSSFHTDRPFLSNSTTNTALLSPPHQHAPTGDFEHRTGGTTARPDAPTTTPPSVPPPVRASVPMLDAESRRAWLQQYTTYVQRYSPWTVWDDLDNHHASTSTAAGSVPVSARSTPKTTHRRQYPPSPTPPAPPSAAPSSRTPRAMPRATHRAIPRAIPRASPGDAPCASPAADRRFTTRDTSAVHSVPTQPAVAPAPPAPAAEPNEPARKKVHHRVSHLTPSEDWRRPTIPTHRSLHPYSHSSHTPRAEPRRAAAPGESAKPTRESSLQVVPPSPAGATPRTSTSTHATPRTLRESRTDVAADVYAELEEEAAAAGVREAATPRRQPRRAAGEREQRLRVSVAPLSTSRGRLEHTPMSTTPLPTASPSQRFFLERAGQLTARERPLPLSPQPSLAQMRGSPRVLLARESSRRSGLAAESSATSVGSGGGRSSRALQPQQSMSRLIGHLPRLFKRSGFAAPPAFMSGEDQTAHAEGVHSHRKHLSSQFKGLLPAYATGAYEQAE